MKTNNIKILRFASAALLSAVLFTSCKSDEVDDFRYVESGWENTIGYSIAEVAQGQLNDLNGTAWIITDSELSTSDSSYASFRSEINKFDNVELNFINATSVSDNFFSGFTTITELEMACVTELGASAFEGLQLLRLEFGAEGQYSGPEDFNTIFDGFTAAENCDLVLGVDEFMNVDVSEGEWAGQKWLTIMDVTGQSVIMQPTEVMEIYLADLELNTDYPTDAVWRVLDSTLSEDGLERLRYVINYHGEGTVWLALPYVTEIPEGALLDCTGLYGVVLPEEGVTIGSEAFNGCSSLVSVDNVWQVSTFAYRSFYGCSSLRSIDVSGTDTIAEDMLRNCSSLVSVTVKAASDESPEGVTFANSAFRNCTSLLEIENIDNVLTFGTNVFNGSTALKEIELSMATLGNFIFSGCTSLERVSLPNCTYLGNGGFATCESLVELNLTCDEAITYHASAFNNFSPEQCELTLGENATKAVVNGNEWGGVTWLKINVADIDYEESNNIDLTTINIDMNFRISEPWVVINEGDLADYSEGVAILYSLINDYGSGAVNLELPNITAIPSASATGEVFYGCTGIGTLTLNDAGVTIGESAFMSCSCLTSVVNMGKVISFGGSAFRSCSLLQSADLAGVTTIPTNLFRSCNSLTEILNLDNVTTVASSAFYNSGVTSLDMPSATSLDATVFSGCAALTELKLTASDAITTVDNTFDNLDTESCALTLGSTEAGNVYTGYNWKDKYWSVIMDASGNPIDSTINPPVYQEDIIIDYLTGSESFTTATTWIVPDAGDITAARYATLVSLINGLSGVQLELYNVTSLGDSVFENATGLGSVTLTWADDASAKQIANSTFKGCTALITVILPNSSKLMDEIFSGAPLTTLNLAGSGDIEYQSATFSGFTSSASCMLILNEAAYQSVTDGNIWANLTWSTVINIDEPQTQDAIDLLKLTGAETFSTSEPWVVINEGSLADYASGLTKLITLIIDAGKGVVDLEMPNITTILAGVSGGSTFRDCDGLRSVKLLGGGADGVYINSQAFRECDYLETFMANASYIGNNSISRCDLLSEVILTYDGAITLGGTSVFTSTPSTCNLTLSATEYNALEEGSTTWGSFTWNSISLYTEE